MTLSVWGTGRKDYSKNVEYSTVPMIRSHQVRDVSTMSDTYYSFDYPYVSGVAINIAQPSVDPTNTTGSYDLSNVYTDMICIEANGNWFIHVGWIRYANYGAVAALSTDITTYGIAFGFGRACLKWKNPLFWDATEPYCDVLYYNIMMENPYPSLPLGWPPDIYTITGQIHQFKDTVAGPVISA